jgi:hypothetical protein
MGCGSSGMDTEYRSRLIAHLLALRALLTKAS